MMTNQQKDIILTKTQNLADRGSYFKYPQYHLQKMIKLLESTRFFKVQMTKNVMPNIENTMGGLTTKQPVNITDI